MASMNKMKVTESNLVIDGYVPKNAFDEFDVKSRAKGRERSSHKFSFI
jgi:hypothetical protein